MFVIYTIHSHVNKAKIKEIKYLCHQQKYKDLKVILFHFMLPLNNRSEQRIRNQMSLYVPSPPGNYIE